MAVFDASSKVFSPEYKYHKILTFKTWKEIICQICFKSMWVNKSK